VGRAENFQASWIVGHEIVEHLEIRICNWRHNQAEPFRVCITCNLNRSVR
jgi:hypothetical protein